MIFRPPALPGTPLDLLGTLCATLALTLSACGVEPDEIDYLSGDTGGGTETTDSEGMTGDGDGDGDPGDGDGEPGDGDGDGDGDTGDGDGEPGDGDGDAGDGDGDGGDELGCDELNPLQLAEGANAVTVSDGPSVLEASCGALGPESIYAFTAPVDGLARFTLSGATFDAALYVVSVTCDPLEEIACIAAPDDPLELEQLMIANQTYYIVVDSLAAGGTATLDVTLN